MKKVLLSVALVLAMSFGASAQFGGKSDSFFNDWDDVDNGLLRETKSDYPGMPTMHNSGSNESSTPLGSGLLILTALGAGYALTKKNEK